MTTDDVIGKLEFVDPDIEMNIFTPTKPDAWLFMSSNRDTKWSFYGYPNAWRRFWYRSLLGWRFERISDEKGAHQ